MPDFTELVDVIKQAALKAVRAAKPAEVLIGRVACAEPLRIDLGHNFVLEGAQLTLTRAVTRHTVNATVVGGGIDAGRSDGAVVQYTVDCTLKAGDQALLIQRQGGQQYIVIGVLP